MRRDHLIAICFASSLPADKEEPDLSPVQHALQIPNSNQDISSRQCPSDPPVMFDFQHL